MEHPYMIKCNCTGPRYLYWSGAHWTSEIARAANYDSKKEAEKEIKKLSWPNVADARDVGPEAFTLDLARSDYDPFARRYKPQNFDNPYSMPPLSTKHFP